MENNKGQVMLIAIIMLAIFVVGTIYYGESVKEIKYIGDKLEGIVYNIESKNPNCDFETIKIDETNVELFETFQEAKLKHYNLSVICP